MSIDRKQKTLIIVPHQDDEINIAGGYIASLKDTSNVYVLYTTNGDFMFNAKYRYKEAFKSLKILGKIPKERVIFLGYSDQAYDKNTHMYNQKEDWTSINGFSETYAPNGYVDWNYYKYGKHCKYNVDNFIRNIKEVILEVKPDLIICVDLDFHPDHIMTSICTEKALGMILKEYLSYRPILYKTFAYENSYLGPNDFFEKEYKPSHFNYDEDGVIRSNPYYNINDSIRIGLNYNCYSKNLFINRIFKAILCHHSQVLVSHAGQMINSDMVYWKRRTDNLIMNADISVSSGDASCLNDFVLCDTKNVLNGNKREICYNENIWIPSKQDDEKEIIIDFDNKKHIKYINLYNGRKNKKFIKKILIYYNNHKKEVLLDDKYINKIIIDDTIETLKIRIIDKVAENGFSEIEAFEAEEYFNSDEIIIKAKSSLMVNNFNKIFIKSMTILQKIYRRLFIK
jgi:LmbE family N-acetylglucosaminyl deacetylase